MKKLLLLCSLSVALLAPCADSGAQQKANPAGAGRKVKRVIDSMARAIEVYRTGGSLKGAMRHVQVAEEEVAALSYVLPAGSPLLNALETARSSLTKAALISEAYRGRRSVPDEEMESLSAICEEYGIRPTRAGRLRVGECVKVIMRELRRNQREAVAVATREGMYTP